MKKRINVSVMLCMIGILCVLLSGVRAQAATEGNYKYSVKKGKAVIEQYTGKSKSVTIPKKLGGKKVTEIGENAFKGCTFVKSIKIPNGVTKIDNWAFSDCKISKLHIPKSVTSIASRAFNNAYLTKITVASGNKVYDSRNKCNAIIKKAKKKKVLVGYKEVLNKNYDPDDYDATDADTWEYYPKEVYEKRMVTELVLGCKNTKIPKGVTHIGSDAFSAVNIKKITIPEGVTEIGYCSFYGCKNLKEITFPQSLEIVGSCAFTNCKSLSTVTLPENVTVIADWAFNGCKKLSRITVQSTKLNRFSISDSDTLKGTSANLVISVPAEKLDEYTTYFKNKGNKNVKVQAQ